MTESQSLQNTSGQGSSAVVPAEVLGKFNWGACLLNWIWGLGNKTYITLLVWLISFIPLVGLFASIAFVIWCGVKGNAWAWQNKRFESVEAFHAYQKKWATAGVIVWSVSIVLSILCFLLLGAAMFAGSSY